MDLEARASEFPYRGQGVRLDHLVGEADGVFLPALVADDDVCRPAHPARVGDVVERPHVRANRMARHEPFRIDDKDLHVAVRAEPEAR